MERRHPRPRNPAVPCHCSSSPPINWASPGHEASFPHLSLLSPSLPAAKSSSPRTKSPPRPRLLQRRQERRPRRSPPS
uniref:Uncharacterized protein n=1 Tax=Arundo donax TaxID=35708 RepID=A0A0A9FQU4_ARUDO